MASLEDKLDRLLVSFKDAKAHNLCLYFNLKPDPQQIALLEWSDTAHDLITVSIHTYERAPQLVRKPDKNHPALAFILSQLSLDSPLFCVDLRVDPHSRCAALSLPKHAIAILPFYQTQAELDVMEQDQSQPKQVVQFLMFVFVPSWCGLKQGCTILPEFHFRSSNPGRRKYP